MRNSDRTTIKTFTDLVAWQKNHEVVVKIYRITRNFPKEELYGLTSQMRQCAVSITSNIAEGFSRQSAAERTQFYYIAQGSLTELKNQLLIARDVGYLEERLFQEFAEELNTSHAILQGLIKKSKEFVRQNHSITHIS